MDELYVFGYGYNQQFPKRLQTDAQEAEYLDVKTLSTPTCVLSAEDIEIVWASWCDLILKVNNKYHYTGTSLLPAQVAAITSLPVTPSQPPVFFGRHDTSGVLGFIHPTASTLTTFSTPQETAQGAPSTVTTNFASSPQTILAIHFTASDAALVHLAPLPPTPATIIQLPSLQHLLDFLTAPSAEHTKRTAFPPTHIATNAATLTVLSPQGTLHTLATDRRFARAAGRDPDGSTDADANTAQPVPFLEHTTIAKVVAGGLYTAALAEDGELYLWGQAMAGTLGELRCLAMRGDDEDEFVRTVEVREGARVVDVGVGGAHVLVAVEGGGGREVWAAGDNRYGALGLGVEMEGRESVEEFAVVEALRGKRVKQVVCAGMSSFVVVERGGKDGKTE